MEAQRPGEKSHQGVQKPPTRVALGTGPVAPSTNSMPEIAHRGPAARFVQSSFSRPRGPKSARPAHARTGVPKHRFPPGEKGRGDNATGRCPRPCPADPAVTPKSMTGVNRFTVLRQSASGSSYRQRVVKPPRPTSPPRARHDETDPAGTGRQNADIGKRVAAPCSNSRPRLGDKRNLQSRNKPHISCVPLLPPPRGPAGALLALTVPALPAETSPISGKAISWMTARKQLARGDRQDGTRPSDRRSGCGSRADRIRQLHLQPLRQLCDTGRNPALDRRC